MIKDLEFNAGVGAPKETMEYVDLGLPSGIMWAKCDLGETVPESYGHSYAWGETWLKVKSNKENYYFNNGKWGEFFKYNTVVPNGEKNRIFLDKEDDVAFLRLGEGWRMPTWRDWGELFDNCTATEAILNDVKGAMFISKKNHNHIFIAYDISVAVGTCRWTNTLVNGGTEYAAAISFKIYGDGHIDVRDPSYEERWRAFPIRPVYVKRNVFEP